MDYNGLSRRKTRVISALMAVIRSIQLIWFWAVKPATRWVLHLIDWQEGN